MMERRRRWSDMKKIITLAMFVLVVFGMTVTTVEAKSYKPDDTDIVIEADDTTWKVFTRSNVRGNSEVKSLGVTDEYLYNSMIHTNSYLDMFYVKSNEKDIIEFKVIKEAASGINNYNNLSKKEINDIGSNRAASTDASNWSVYSNDYTYIRLEYTTYSQNYIEYYTVVNQDVYRLVCHKTNKFTDTEIEMIKEIVDSAQYSINPMYADEKIGIAKFWQNNYVQIIVGIICIGVIIAGIILYKKRKIIKAHLTGKSKTKSDESRNIQPTTTAKKQPGTTVKKQPATTVRNQPATTQRKKPVDSSMVTIDRSKRKPRK